MFLMYYIPQIADMRFLPNAADLQREPAILAKSCQIPAARNTKHYSLYLVDDTVVVSLRSAHQQRCAISAVSG
jgi:hypothetical protein